MSIGTVEGEGAAAVWIDIEPAGRPQRPDLLRRAMEDAFAQVPQIQQRHRRALAVATTGTADEGFVLAEAWFAFHRRLFEVRYSLGVRRLVDHQVVVGDQGLSGEAVDVGLAAAAGLSQAHANLVRAIRSAPVPESPSAVGPLAGRLASWRLLRGHDRYLRSAVARVLTLTAGSAAQQAVQLTALVADHLVADQVLAEHWAPVGPRSETSALVAWAGYDQQLRDLIELAVLGPLAAFNRPAAPTPLPADRQGLDDVGVAVIAASRDLPALVARCRVVLSALSGKDTPTQRARERLLQLWGRYDNLVTDLNDWMSGARGGRTTARLLHTELTLVAQLRDELVAALDDYGDPVIP